MCESCGRGSTEATLVNLRTGERNYLGEHERAHADTMRRIHVR
jgi:hypothetical protein